MKPRVLDILKTLMAFDTVSSESNMALIEYVRDLRAQLGVSYLFISHDISTVRALCDDIVVMYSGHKVQAGSRESFAAPPFHPYTDLLIHSVPELRQGWLETCGATSGTLPPVGARAAVPELCTFLNRCPVRIDGLCNRTAPPRRSLDDGSEMLCHHDGAQLIKTQRGLAAQTTGAYA